MIIVVHLLFLSFNNTDVSFSKKKTNIKYLDKLKSLFYNISRRNYHRNKFAKAAFDKNFKVFLVYVPSIGFMIMNLFQKAYIVLNLYR